jgi:hypothetical protein
MGLFSRFLSRALPCTAEGTLCRVRDATLSGSPIVSVDSPPLDAANDASMSSNIEPLARAMATRICRRSGMAEADIPGWVELHWPCAAAMLEVGVMDEAGEWVEDRDVRLGMEAYRERLLRQK